MKKYNRPTFIKNKIISEDIIFNGKNNDETVKDSLSPNNYS